MGLISKIIDFDESKEAFRLVVKPGVNSELDELKRTYEGLGDFLVQYEWFPFFNDGYWYIFLYIYPFSYGKTAVAKEEMCNIPRQLASEMHIVYYPQIGFQLALPLDPNLSIEDQIAIPELEYQVYISLIWFYKW